MKQKVILFISSFIVTTHAFANVSLTDMNTSLQNSLINKQSHHSVPAIHFYGGKNLTQTNISLTIPNASKQIV